LVEFRYTVFQTEWDSYHMFSDEVETAIAAPGFLVQSGWEIAIESSGRAPSGAKPEKRSRLVPTPRRVRGRPLMDGGSA